MGCGGGEGGRNGTKGVHLHMSLCTDVSTPSCCELGFSLVLFAGLFPPLNAVALRCPISLPTFNFFSGGRSCVATVPRAYSGGGGGVRHSTHAHAHRGGHRPFVRVRNKRGDRTACSSVDVTCLPLSLSFDTSFGVAVANGCAVGHGGGIRLAGDALSP